jgi:gluconate 5-dehydrogenase
MIHNKILKIFDLTGKIAFVTGASEGTLGFFMAEALAEAGATVSVSSKTADLSPTLENLKEKGSAGIALKMDVADPQSVKEGFMEIEKKFGKINIVINSAGTIIRKPALEMTIEEWQSVINVNLTGTWLVDREAARLMIRKGTSHGGRIINVSSQLGSVVGMLPESAYYASKAGIIHLTKALAVEWAKYGINVNCIAPGPFYPTKMTVDLTKEPGLLEALAKRTLKGRVGDPSKDLKGAIIYLASDSSDYMTGQTIYVEGGWLSL